MLVFLAVLFCSNILMFLQLITKGFYYICLFLGPFIRMLISIYVALFMLGAPWAYSVTIDLLFPWGCIFNHDWLGSWGPHDPHPRPLYLCAMLHMVYTDTERLPATCRRGRTGWYGSHAAPGRPGRTTRSRSGGAASERAIRGSNPRPDLTWCGVPLWFCCPSLPSCCILFSCCDEIKANYH